MRGIKSFCLSGLGAKRTGLLRINTSDVLPTERGDLGISQQRHEAVFVVTQEAGNTWSVELVLSWLGCNRLCSVGGSQLRAVCRNVLTSHFTILFS